MVEKVEEEETVGMRCCELGEGGWGGGWVRTYLSYVYQYTHSGNEERGFSSSPPEQGSL